MWGLAYKMHLLCMPLFCFLSSKFSPVRIFDVKKFIGTFQIIIFIPQLLMCQLPPGVSNGVGAWSRLLRASSGLEFWSILLPFCSEMFPDSYITNNGSWRHLPKQFHPAWQMACSPDKSVFYNRGPHMRTKWESKFPRLHDRVDKSSVLWGQFWAYACGDVSRRSVGQSVFLAGSLL